MLSEKPVLFEKIQILKKQIRITWIFVVLQCVSRWPQRWENWDQMTGIVFGNQREHSDMYWTSNLWWHIIKFTFLTYAIKKIEEEEMGIKHPKLS